MKYRKVTFSIAALLFSSVTLSCPFHMATDYDENNPIPPGSMQLTLAGMYAEQTGIITSLSPLEGIPAFQRASWWLTLLSNTLEDKGVSGVYILLSDVPLWSSYGIATEQASGMLPAKLQVDVTPLEQPENTIMLTQLTLQAIIEKDISLEEAFANNLILIHKDQKNIKEKLINN